MIALGIDRWFITMEKVHRFINNVNTFMQENYASCKFLWVSDSLKVNEGKFILWIRNRSNVKRIKAFTGP